ncbi:uncharacterized protein [Hemitrygon akajei]|uniref:uncharacterized protein n=1 Tax=Hemitrygon akajei TaxID=2704970 RepID=UPI003BF94B04
MFHVDLLNGVKGFTQDGLGHIHYCRFYQIRAVHSGRRLQISTDVLWRAFIEKIQRRAARFVLNDYSRKSSVTNMLRKLQWEPLENRRTELRLISIFKEVHNIAPSNIQIRHRVSSTRQQTGPYVLETPSLNKICYQYSLYPRSTGEWNLLPPDRRSIPDINIFKGCVSKYVSTAWLSPKGKTLYPILIGSEGEEICAENACLRLETSALCPWMKHCQQPASRRA